MPRDAVQLQGDQDELVKWSERWQMPFNTAKCKVIHLGATNNEHKYMMVGKELEVITDERDLGIPIDASLSFHAQAALAVKKAFRTVGIIRHTFLNLDETTLPLLFKSMVRPLLEYGKCVWGPVYCGDQDKVEQVQRWAARMVASVRHLPYQTRLEGLKLPSMHYRRERRET